MLLEPMIPEIDMIDWSAVDIVLLDMDGTLLDLHFDNHFWLEYVPLRYAEARGLPLEVAKEQLMEQYRSVEGTLDWYCVDHWSQQLGLDIVLLKQEVDHLISVHPHVLAFLRALQQAGKSRVLVTNAHQKSLQLKLQKTRLSGYLDRVVSSHDIGLPKEKPRFWTALQEIVQFDPDRSLFVDDSLSVLRSARQYGIAYLLGISQPDSTQPRRDENEFTAIQDFSALLHGLSEFSGG